VKTGNKGPGSGWPAYTWPQRVQFTADGTRMVVAHGSCGTNSPHGIHLDLWDTVSNRFLRTFGTIREAP